MEDRVGEVLAQRQALESGAAAGVALSVFLHTAAAAIVVYAATHRGAPQMVPMVSVTLVPMAAPAPAKKTAAPPVLHEPAPVVEQTKPVAKPEPKTAPPSPFGKSAKKPSTNVAPAIPPATSSAGNIAGAAPGTQVDSPIGTTSIEGNFPYTIYIQNMNRLIGQHWTRGEVKPGTTATIYFEIDRDGTIRNIEIKKGSGNDFFDRGAVRALRETSPLPPLPFAFSDRFLGVTILFK